ncbi:hypothetical protein QCA50_013732 [Cerrena zonata]|uniref:Uncharacterized protein n=1 Tax=Cerrena zonata TaxID=2478898 RepID=A0AAW0FVZ5_9APHY
MGTILSDGLFSVILRDGTMYYGILVILYVADLINLSMNRGIGEVVTITNAVATVLMCRLMLNIRDSERLAETEILSESTLMWGSVSQTSAQIRSEVHDV